MDKIKLTVLECVLKLLIKDKLLLCQAEVIIENLGFHIIYEQKMELKYFCKENIMYLYKCKKHFLEHFFQEKVIEDI